MTPAQEYVQKYYDLYADGDIDEEMRIVGTFLAKNVRGVALDCGCGPVPQLWSIFMPKMKELYAIDLPQESIDFVKEKIKDQDAWIGKFGAYQGVIEKSFGKQPDDYVSNQVKKLASVQQADMSDVLPFPDNFFDTVMSIYSLGCLKNEAELKQALINIHRVLKPSGILLHVNTNGRNTNDSLPAYTWNGLDQTTARIEKELRMLGFSDITVSEIPTEQDPHAMYKYDSIMLLKATK